MATGQTQRSKRPLADVVRLLFSARRHDDPIAEQKPWVASVDDALVRLVALGWMLLLLAIPVVAVLSLFGTSYMPALLTAAVWMLALSFLGVGVSAVINSAGGTSYASGRPAGPIELLGGVAAILATLHISALMWFIITATSLLPPALMLGLASLLLAVLAACGLARLLLERDQPLFARAASLIGVLGIGGGTLLLTLQHYGSFFGFNPSSPLISANIWFMLLLVGIIANAIASVDRRTL